MAWSGQTLWFKLNFSLPKNESVLNILLYFLEQFLIFSQGLQPLEYTLKCSQLIQTTRKLVDNQKCQAGFRALCNKILKLLSFRILIRNSLLFVRCFLCLIFLLLFFFACTLNAVRIGFIKLYLTAKHTGRKIIKNERIPAVGLPLHGNVNSIVRAFLE